MSLVPKGREWSHRIPYLSIPSQICDKTVASGQGIPEFLFNLKQLWCLSWRSVATCCIGGTRAKGIARAGTVWLCGHSKAQKRLENKSIGITYVSESKSHLEIG